MNQILTTAKIVLDLFTNILPKDKIGFNYCSENPGNVIAVYGARSSKHELLFLPPAFNTSICSHFT